MNRKAREHTDYRRYRDRNRVERVFGTLKQERRIATRYDKTVSSFENFLHLAAARLWLQFRCQRSLAVKLRRFGTLYTILDAGMKAS